MRFGLGLLRAYNTCAANNRMGMRKTRNGNRRSTNFLRNRGRAMLMGRAVGCARTRTRRRLEFARVIDMRRTNGHRRGSNRTRMHIDGCNMVRADLRSLKSRGSDRRRLFPNFRCSEDGRTALHDLRQHPDDSCNRMSGDREDKNGAQPQVLRWD